MKRFGKLFLVLLASVMITVGYTGQPKVNDKRFAQADAMIAEINSRRAANGLPPYTINAALMTAAQAHSEYQASVGTATHSGAGGSRPADRAAAAGYGNGAQIFVTENIYATTSASPAVAVDWWIADGGWHLEGVLSSKYTDIGVGVAVSGGVYYYTLDVGYIAGAQSQTNSGSVGSNPTQLAAKNATQAALPKPVSVATPAADGSVIHIVEQGQTLWTVAAKYNIPLADLLKRNNLSENSYVYPGDRLIILPSNTPSPENILPATDTPKELESSLEQRESNLPTAQMQSIETVTPSLTAISTKPAIKPRQEGLKLDPIRAILAILIGVIALGAVIFLSFSKESGEEKKNEW